MRKDWMKMTCLILCLALCLGGSAMAVEGKVAMGRYVEVPLDISGEGWGAFAQANGAIYAVDRSGDALLKSLDLNKNNWDYLETGHDEQTSPAQGGVNGLAVGADGALYLSSGWAMVNEEGYPYVERIKDGKPQRVQLDQRLDMGKDRLMLCVLPSGELLGLSDIEAYRFSPDGVTQQKYAVSGGTFMAAYGNEVAICSTKNSLITVLDIESGQTLRTLPLPSAARYGVIGYDAKGALYYVSPDGLYQVNAGDTLMMQIADGRLMSAGKPSVEGQALLFDSENNPVVAYSQGGSMSLIAYRYDGNVATEPDTMMTVFTLYDSGTLREYANKFQQKYPDAMVDIIVALPLGTAITRDDAIRTLNTEILAGRGPDVIVLDGLPVQSYIDKGVLQDLSSTVQPMIDSGALLNSIAGAFKMGDEISAVPTRFLMPSVWGDVEGLNTIEDMANWANENPDTLPLYAVDVETLIGTFYSSCAPAWFTEDGRLYEAKIEAFLIAMKTIRGPWTYDAYVLETGNDIKARMKERGTQEQAWNPYSNRTDQGRSAELFGMNLMSAGKQTQLPFVLRGVDNTSYPNGALVTLEKGSFAPLPGQAEGCFIPMLLLGASKSTANSDMALKFIEFALTEESQNIELEEGFQVNVKALHAAQERDKPLFGSSGGGTPEYRWSTTWLDPAQQKKLRGM
ncbi:MAG: hypothetical protein RSD95_15075, partial [Clostridia bacterium]